jgi:hypothetical protein
MDILPQKIAEYRYLLEQEKQIAARKEQLRSEIFALMQQQHLQHFTAPHGVAHLRTRFKLIPHTQEVLQTLTAEDILPFANFTTEKVKTLLVPKYGRERLLPLFDTEHTTYLQVSQPPANMKEPF